MAYISNGWIKIEPSTGSGNTEASATILEVNFSRTNTRRASITGRTDHGDEAHATIVQPAYGPYIEIDHIEDSHGDDIADYLTPYTLGFGENTLTIVGYSNLFYLFISETSEKDCTNINDDTDPNHPDSFTLTDSSSNTHTEPLDDEMSQDYGVVDRYMFSITFILRRNETSTQRTIGIMVSDGGSLERSVSDTITFYQDGFQPD